jgi:hypothetical protein
MDGNEGSRMLWAQPRFEHGNCYWPSAQEGYLLLGFDWAGCADLADEGADSAAIRPLDGSGPNMIDRDRGAPTQPGRQLQATHTNTNQDSSEGDGINSSYISTSGMLGVDKKWYWIHPRSSTTLIWPKRCRSTIIAYRNL